MMNGLYDTPADVVSKAIRGQGLMPANLKNVTADELSSFIRGRSTTASARKIAKDINLSPDALANFKKPRPQLELPPSIHRLELPFEDETVNAWLIDAPNGKIVIDAGFRRQDLLNELENVPNIHLLITHMHRDHIGGVNAITPYIAQLYAPGELPEAKRIKAGDQLNIAGLSIRIFDLAGHHPEAVGYHISGLGPDVIAVGDAIFANSMGGCAGPVAYQTAKRTIMNACNDLRDDTIILTGHGPATTLATEWTRNPFLAAWKNT